MQTGGDLAYLKAKLSLNSFADNMKLFWLFGLTASQVEHSYVSFHSTVAFLSMLRQCSKLSTDVLSSSSLLSFERAEDFL